MESVWFAKSGHIFRLDRAKRMNPINRWLTFCLTQGFWYIVVWYISTHLCTCLCGERTVLILVLLAILVAQSWESKAERAPAWIQCSVLSQFAEWTCWKNVLKQVHTTEESDELASTWSCSSGRLCMNVERLLSKCPRSSWDSTILYLLFGLKKTLWIKYNIRRSSKGPRLSIQSAWYLGVD